MWVTTRDAAGAVGRSSGMTGGGRRSPAAAVELLTVCQAYAASRDHLLSERCSLTAGGSSLFPFN